MKYKNYAVTLSFMSMTHTYYVSALTDWGAKILAGDLHKQGVYKNLNVVQRELYQAGILGEAKVIETVETS